MTNGAVIKIENVSKKYCRSLRHTMLYGVRDIARNTLGMGSSPNLLREGEFWALDNISFEVGKGQTLGIIGANGSGKTTLLKLLNGIFLPDKGRIALEGRVGALIEVGAGFHPLLTGRENVYVNGAILGMTKKEIDKKFEQIIGFSGIEDFIDVPVKHYSSGMYVRLGFSVAAHSDPDILLVDEVLAVGDVQFQLKCFRKLSEFKKAGKTILFVTHNMEAVVRHTDKAVLLDKGVIRSIDSPNNAVNRYLELISGEPGPGDAEKEAFSFSGEAALSGTPEKTSLLNMRDDACAKRKNYNSNEFRYGNGSARIVDFELIDTSGKEITHTKSADMVAFRFKVKFYERVEKPVFGMTIKTKDGIEAYGHNTLYKEMDVGARDKGDTLWVEYKMTFNLQAGDYFLAAGVVESVSGQAVPLDRRYDLARITVLPVDKSYGIANMKTDVRVYNENA